MYKAKFVARVRDKYEKDHTELMYEYRGYNYFVTIHHNGYMDKPLKVRHEEEQRKIDERIENASKPIPEDKSNEVWEALEDFYRYVEEN